MRLALTTLGGFQVIVDQQPTTFATNPTHRVPATQSSTQPFVQPSVHVDDMPLS